MDLVGYCDPLTVAPGDTIRFMVSSRADRYEAAIVRLIHGDVNQAGPGFKEEDVPTDVDGEYDGYIQPLRTGSYVVVPDSPSLRAPSGATLVAYVFPTAPHKGVQGLLTKWLGADDAGYAFVLDETGAAALWLGGGRGRIQRVATGAPLRARTWYRVSATYDAPARRVLVSQSPVVEWPQDSTAASVEAEAEIRPLAAEAPFLIAACGDRWERSELLTACHFNGKIDSPRVLGASGELLAAWDFSRDSSSVRVSDASGNGNHGECVNMPTRAVTGRNWTGSETSFALAPDEYGAIHFHDDDLEDVRWQPAFELTVPATMRSGFYAARLRAGEAEDHVPFVVRPPRGRATARIAFLAPTISYVVYANEHLSYQNPRTPPVFSDILERLAVEDHYIRDNRLLSCYDHHSDGSGVVHASRLRPLLTMRPRYRLALIDAPHQLPADLHLIDWLEVKGFPYDVVADDDLHTDGLGLLQRYNVVLTGSHPEYWTTPMIDALDGYLAGGGRVMYLGGNGMCWVTTLHAERPYVVELRRGRTDGAIWESEPGEEHNASTGELGGFWPRRGRGHQQLGVWFTAQGFDRSLPYHRAAGSFDPRASWIFEGVGADEPIGAFGLVMGGAAGFEFDRVDLEQGTPPHALLLATATGFSDSYEGLAADWLREPYQTALQERLGAPERGSAVQYVRGAGGTTNPLVRCDMVFFETLNHGAVFSTGSIAWCGALSSNGYENNVSRITENVLRRFSADGAFQ